MMNVKKYLIDKTIIKIIKKFFILIEITLDIGLGN